jgi:hypothetical protein
VATIDRACNREVLRQAAEGELGALIVIGQLAAGLAQQLIDRHVAGGHAQQVAIQAQPLSRPGLAGDLAHVDAADMAHAFFVQRFKHGAVQMAGDPRLPAPQQRAISGIGAHVHQRCNLHALLVQIERGEVTVVVARQHHRAFARLDRVEFHQALRGAGQHHPGKSLLRNITGWSNEPLATRHWVARTLYMRLP